MSFDKLKVYVPDWTEQYDKPYCSPFFYPMLDDEKDEERLAETYGTWYKDVCLVDELSKCDIVVLLYELSYYYSKNKVAELKQINNSASAVGKLTVCWVKGDSGITPS